jgi:hypothetical protein
VSLQRLEGGPGGVHRPPAERYWQLVGVINGRPPFPPRVPAFEWLIAALRAQG